LDHPLQGPGLNSKNAPQCVQTLRKASPQLSLVAFPDLFEIDGESRQKPAFFKEDFATLTKDFPAERFSSIKYLSEYKEKDQ